MESRPISAMGRAIERLKKKKITTEYKPYKCTVCDKTFVSKQGLNGHIERLKKKKITTEYKPYNCSVCDKTFVSKQGLNGHIERLNAP